MFFQSKHLNNFGYVYVAMAIVIHVINGNHYAYSHFKVNGELKSRYLGPVDKNNRIRKVKYGGKGVERAPVGTSKKSLMRIYDKAVRRQAQEDAERAKHNKRR